MRLRLNPQTIAFLLVSITPQLTAQQTARSSPQVFAGAKVEEIYRVILKRGDLLLESIDESLRENHIQEGQVMVTAGSVDECTFHFVQTTDLKPKNVFKTVKGPYEILNAAGIVAGGEPHIHITIASRGHAAIGGHLEKNCRILYLGEVTILKFSAPPLTRKPDASGVMMLQPK